MSKYKKKPVVIEAVQFVPGEIIIDRWVADALQDGTITSEDNRAFIDTLEGRVELKEYDYLIKGVKGELYPCREDIFEETYEEVECCGDRWDYYKGDLTEEPEIYSESPGEYMKTASSFRQDICIHYKDGRKEWL